MNEGTLRGQRRHNIKRLRAQGLKRKAICEALSISTSQYQSAMQSERKAKNVKSPEQIAIVELRAEGCSEEAIKAVFGEGV